ncbi:hypothetical protein C2G38_2160395 [Gigaspora rosea]|uniref:MULE transposase domain-containing protein n=1 Tax=Gigaspora rosea TaxID=44941 RepID=A0A397VY77_9GLOM|nr:hypothetical protein C2G38_2160395 [Gigaspora rosea]
MNNNTIIKIKELLLFFSLFNIEGDHNNNFDDSTEFSWIHWLFDTVDNSSDESTIEACGSQNGCEMDNNFDQLNTNIRDLDFLKGDKDTEPSHLDILKDNFDQLITHKALRITNTNGLLKIKTNNKDEDIAPKMEFNNWKELDEWLQGHGLEYGFAFMITHSEKDKEDGIPHHCVYTRIKGIKYILQKEAHIVKGCNKGHYAENCKFHINTYRRKKDNLVYITKIEGQYNHELIKNIDMVASYYRKLSPEICNKMRLLAASGVHSGAIVEILQCKYIHSLNVYNMQKQENPTFHIDARFEAKDNHLTALCWMRPSQLQLWGRFQDIVLLDITAKTNRYSMILCVVILIDNYNRSRLGATALVSDETKKHFLGYLIVLIGQQADLVQSTQCVESYNGIIKNNVNGTSSLLELDHIIKRLLMKESQFVKFK